VRLARPKLGEKRGHVSSPGPRKMVSACAAASSGSDGDVQAAEHDIGTEAAVVVRDGIARRADVM
jgi:hypothetical protein